MKSRDFLMNFMFKVQKRYHQERSMQDATRRRKY